MWQNMVEFIKGMDKISIIITVIVIVGLLLLFIKKQYGVFIEAIRKAETTLNSGEGQKKLDYAVEYIQSKLPMILKPFLTKRIIVSIIEYLLNKGLQYMDSTQKVDIKGNE